ITVVTALQHRRRLGRKRKLEEGYAATRGKTSVSAEPDPLAWLLADEQRSLVRQAIAVLPSKDAEILLLKHTEDWSYRQLSEHLGISTSAVDARLHRARKRMRRALASLAPTLVPR
ncbi:MAG: RNA polymerase sigma factor, partial [Bythopirellula sp.]